MKLFFSKPTTNTLLKLIYEGSEWKTLEYWYQKLNFVKKRAIAFNLFNECEGYTHGKTNALNLLYENTPEALRPAVFPCTIDSFTKELVYDGSTINVGFIRIIPEKHLQTYETYVFTTCEITPLVFEELKKVIYSLQEIAHSLSFTLSRDQNDQ